VASYREVSPGEPLRADVGTWKVVFEVALVGCKDDLDQLTEEDLGLLQREFLKPSRWSNLLLLDKRYNPAFRDEVAHRVDEILGQPRITDVLFHDISVLDHNVQ